MLNRIITLENMQENMPVLKITVNETVGYLLPFRWYRFQVSATKDGQLDFVSSEVIGLKHLLQIEKQCGRGYESNSNPQTELAAALAITALNNWATSCYGKDIDVFTIKQITKNKKFWTFINECLESLRKI